MGQKVTPHRVVVDTNVLVSGLLFGGEPGKIRDLWIKGRIVPLLSSETFTEFNRVLSYPKFRLSPAEITMLIEEELLPYAEILDVTEDATGVCRDPKDDKFLSLAASGKAAYLITGDQDLLVLQLFQQTRIVTVSELLGMM
jgi:putative PIN family toxin of toxin-antitoxin system